MKKQTRIVMIEVYTLLYSWIEQDIEINPTTLNKMFELLLNKDRRFFRYCSEDIENSILTLENLLIKLELSDIEIKECSKFITACVTVANFDNTSKEEVSLKLDKLYYNAALAQFYIFDTLDSKNKFEDFKNEFFQIGVQIGNFYKADATEKDKKDILKNIIKSKSTDLFDRFGFTFQFALCCS